MDKGNDDVPRVTASMGNGRTGDKVVTFWSQMDAIHEADGSYITINARPHELNEAHSADDSGAERLTTARYEDYLLKMTSWAVKIYTVQAKHVQKLLIMLTIILFLKKKIYQLHQLELEMLLVEEIGKIVE